MSAIPANPLETWRLKQQPKKVTYDQIGKRCGGKAASKARRWCLPFDHPAFEMPREATKVLIFEMTGGEVDPNAWAGIRLTAGAAA